MQQWNLRCHGSLGCDVSSQDERLTCTHTNYAFSYLFLEVGDLLVSFLWLHIDYVLICCCTGVSVVMTQWISQRRQMKVSGITRQRRPTWFNCFQVEHVNATQKLLLVWPYHQCVNAASVQHGSVFLFMWGGIKLVRGDDDVPFRVCILFNFLKNGSQVFFSSAGGCLCPDGTGSFEFQDTFTSFLSETKPKILFTCWEAQKRCQLGCTSCI